jgi:hypothetical protein
MVLTKRFAGDAIVDVGGISGREVVRKLVLNIPLSLV